MSDNVCEICGKTSATEDGFWNLCPSCHQLYIDFLSWLRHYPNLNANDIKVLKELIGKKLREDSKREEIFATLSSIVQK